MAAYIPLIWLIAGLFMIGVEFIIPGFVIFFFGVGALVLSLLTWIIPGFNNAYAIQIVVWLVTSFVSVAFFRRFFSRIFRGKVQKGSAEDDFALKTARVIEPIRSDKPGRVTFEGTTWKAICYEENIKKGDIVRVLQKDNLTLVVTRSRELS